MASIGEVLSYQLTISGGQRINPLHIRAACALARGPQFQTMYWFLQVLVTATVKYFQGSPYDSALSLSLNNKYQFR